MLLQLEFCNLSGSNQSSLLVTSNIHQGHKTVCSLITKLHCKGVGVLSIMLFDEFITNIKLPYITAIWIIHKAMQIKRYIDY